MEQRLGVPLSIRDEIISESQMGREKRQERCEKRSASLDYVHTNNSNGYSNIKNPSRFANEKKAIEDFYSGKAQKPAE